MNVLAGDDFQMLKSNTILVGKCNLAGLVATGAMITVGGNILDPVHGCPNVVSVTAHQPT